MLRQSFRKKTDKTEKIESKEENKTETKAEKSMEGNQYSFVVDFL